MGTPEQYFDLTAGNNCVFRNFMSPWDHNLWDFASSRENGNYFINGTFKDILVVTFVFAYDFLEFESVTTGSNLPIKPLFLLLSAL